MSAGRKPIPEHVIRSIRKLHRAGVALRVIASHLGVSLGTVVKYTKRKDQT